MREWVGVKASWLLRMQLCEGVYCWLSACGQIQMGRVLQFGSDMTEWINNNSMEWEGLQLLLKAPKKKYIKKLLEYVIAISNASTAVPPLLSTPISQEFTADLELSAEESHQLLTALHSFLTLARSIGFQQQALREALTPHLPEELSGILVDIACRLSEDIGRRDAESVRQADRLVQLEWALEMEVASDKGKANVPVVRLDLKTSRESSMSSTVLELKGTEFEVFFKNLQKMKEQLGQLVASSD